MTDVGKELYRVADDFASHMRLLDIMRSEGEDTKPLEQTIADYFTHDCTRDRIDSAINYVRHCETMAAAAAAESERCKLLAMSYRTQAQWIKDTAKNVLEMSGQKRLEGLTAGSLTLRANGGRQAVQITDASLVPEEMVTYQGTISGAAMDRILKAIPDLLAYCNTDATIWMNGVELERIPNKGRIGEALSGKCAECRGSGRAYDVGFPDNSPCTYCAGDGLARVPGARLEPRGYSVIVR